MPGKTLSIAETLTTSVPKLFDQAQNTTANHQKNRVALYKLHKEAADVVETVQNGKSIKLIGERAFEVVFIDMVNHILQIKKGVGNADRVVKFIGGYVRFINEKAAEDKVNDEDDSDTTASRFVARLLQHLMKGFLTKDKTVRYRVLQIVAEMISHLGEIDDDIYATLRGLLIERINDKEYSIRVQAVIALSKLAGTEDSNDLAEGEPDALSILMDVLQYDLVPEVRRAALLNIPVSEESFPVILSRTRDTDDLIRKMVYSHAMVHVQPERLSIEQRELIVRNGLGDRLTTVRAAAGQLVAGWVDHMDGDLVNFLKLFDLSENEITADALLSIFVTRSDIFDNLEFKDEFWDNLTAEKALLIRVFVEHCKNTKDENRLETSLPVVTALAFKIQSAYNDLVEQKQVYDEAKLSDEFTKEDEDANEDALANQQFMIIEMLRLAVNLDYGDEIGRRKMFNLVRDMICRDTLPDILMEYSLDVLRVLSPSERDLIRVVVEIVHEIRDNGEPEREYADEVDEGAQPDYATTKSSGQRRPELSPEEQVRAALLDVRCLNLCIGMLERVNGTFEDNSTLDGILGDLILPNVRAKELVLRTKGLVSLGLCCLIDKRMALNSFQLFINQVQETHDTLRIQVLKIIYDLLMVHEGEFLGRGPASVRIVEFLLHILENEESQEGQAIACIGMSKLMLSGMVTEERVLKCLIQAYVSPCTKDNQELRQCLSYFFPVYCYSSPTNQRKLQKVAVETYKLISETYSNRDEDFEMITPNQAVLLLVDWTDPRNILEASNQPIDEFVHIDLAIDIVKCLLASETIPDDRKVLSQALGKLYLPDIVDDNKIRTLKLLLNTLQRRRAPKEAVIKNAISKFVKTIETKFAAQLETFNEDDFRKLEDLKELFELLDEINSDDDESPRHTRAKSASAKVALDNEEYDESTPKVKGKHIKGRNAVISQTPRTLPRRAAKSRPSISTPIEYSSDSSLSEISDGTTPSPPLKRKARTSKEHPVTKRQREEAALDRQINDILSSDKEDAQDDPPSSESTDDQVM